MNGERRLIVVSDSETMSTCAYGCGGFTAGNYWWILTWLLGEVWLLQSRHGGCDTVGSRREADLYPVYDRYHGRDSRRRASEELA